MLTHTWYQVLLANWAPPARILAAQLLSVLLCFQLAQVSSKPESCAPLGQEGSTNSCWAFRGGLRQ